MKKLIALASVLLLTACQTAPKPITPMTQESLRFSITGKIGITTMTPDGKQANSAFYAWTQEQERFAIDLTGAFGMGATHISFDGQTATLTSDRTGHISASTPEELLLRATGQHAPISQLPRWIVGQVATGDSDSVMEHGQLKKSTNSGWTAEFDYQKTIKPSRLTITHTDGHKVVMTITHAR